MTTADFAGQISCQIQSRLNQSRFNSLGTAIIRVSLKGSSSKASAQCVSVVLGVIIPRAQSSVTFVDISLQHCIATTESPASGQSQTITVEADE